MIDFPIADLLDPAACKQWLAPHLHPGGLRCPVGQSEQRRVARRAGAFEGYRCRACDGYYTLVSGTAFARTHQPPTTLVLLLRGIAKGESTARLARELKLSRKQAHTLRQRVQRNLYAQQPNDVLAEAVFEADELYQNAGEKKRPAPRPTRPAAAAR